MVEIFITETNNNSLQKSQITKGVWIDVTAPEPHEIDLLVEHTGVKREFLFHPLDLDEQARIDQEGDQILIIVDIPYSESDQDFYTVPLGIIIVRDEFIITVCSVQSPVIEDFKREKVKGFFTYKKTRFVFQLFQQIASYYLKYLRMINRKREQIESILHQSMKNEEIFNLLDLEKSLVYFTTSLKANELLMEKMLRLKILNMYEEDKDVLEDAIIENKQAIEMAHIYSNILSGMMDAFASIISNNLNIVMKFLTSVTLVLSIPTMVASFFGMNVSIPMQNYPHAFLMTIILSLLLSVLLAIYFRKKDLF
ncbi:magnesium transporter [Carboxydocella thermautotrophica]|nr:magnesium transporter [Carboxydocella thermautotrophica]